MKNTIKKISAFLLSLVLLFGIVPLADLDIIASAETYSGTCGDNLTWTLDTETGELVISGEGDMYDWAHYSSVPWYSDHSYIKTIIIGDSVTSICNYAFYDCDNLTSIEIPNSVTSIGDSAFLDCSGLTSVTIGNGVTSIGDAAFYSCDNLASIDIPDSVLSIGNSAFEYCSGLTSITIGNGVTSIGRRAFDDTGYYYDPTNWDNYVLYIEDYLIEAKDTISGVYIVKERTKKIVDGAFYDCTSLTSIDIPNSVTSIGDRAFYHCASLTSIDIPNSVTSIGTSAFAVCVNLTSIDIPDSVTSIGGGAFYNCNSLTSVTIGNSVRSIGDSAFANCDNLTTIDIPDSVLSIGNYAFEYCDNLTSVTIGNGVTSIGYEAFEDCDNLTTIDIPDSITSISSRAFSGCTSLTDVYYNGTEKQWNEITISSYNDPLLNANIHFLGEDVHECDYTAVVTPPTCQTQGYTTYTCEECGDSYVDDYTDTVDHYYLDGKCIWCGDTNVTPSSIIDITYTPSDSARKLFTVTCADRAQMIQFIEPDGGTRTYYRNNANVKITSYNADGEVVGELSRDLAYEVWEIYSNMSIGTTIKVRAKFNSRWELDKRSLVVYEYNPVISMELSRTSGKKGPVPATVVADEKTENVKFKMPNGTSVTVTQFTTDENGNRVFKGNAWANEDGLNVITVTIRRKNVTKTVGTLEYTVE